jgi:hypothetical protein
VEHVFQIQEWIILRILDTKSTPWFKQTSMDSDNHLTRRNEKPLSRLKLSDIQWDCRADMKILEQNGI